MKKVICLILSIVTVIGIIPMGTLAEERPFPDVPADAWYTEYIVEAHEMGIMQGDEKGNMMPTKPITRAEAVTILYNNCDRLYDYPDVTEIPFTDVKKSDWFYEEVRWAYCEGFVQGVGNNKFKPNDYVTRQDLVVMIQRYYNLYDIYDPTMSDGIVISKETEFQDSDKISDYARYPVRLFTSLFYYNNTGEYSRYSTEYIMSGYNGYFMPKANCSRAEATKILVNLYKSATFKYLYIYHHFIKYNDIPYSVTSLYQIVSSDAYFFESHWDIDYDSSNTYNCFGANEYITRLDLVKLIEYLIPNYSYWSPKYDEYSFTDYSGSYANYAEYAYQEGYILLRSDGTFAPDDYVTVEEALYFINQFNKMNDFTITVDRTSEYTDWNEVSSEYQNAVRLAISDITKHVWEIDPYFVLMEEGKILPQNYITRLQFFKMLKVDIYWAY